LDVPFGKTHTLGKIYFGFLTAETVHTISQKLFVRILEVTFGKTHTLGKIHFSFLTAETIA